MTGAQWFALGFLLGIFATLRAVWWVLAVMYRTVWPSPNLRQLRRIK